MEFLVWKRREAENKGMVDANCVLPHIWISISTPGAGHIKLPENRFRKGELFLEFDDIDGSEGKVFIQGRRLFPILWDQVTRILDFVDNHKDSIKLICVNCHEGFSRSPAVCAALSMILDKNDSGILNDYRYECNPLVLRRLLIMAWDRRKPFIGEQINGNDSGMSIE